MSALLRKALFWLVMLALPLHGIAAAGTGPLHAPGDAGAHMQAGMAMGMHAGAATPTIAAQAAADDAGMQLGCDHGLDIHKCRLSAVCGLVAGPVPEIAELVRPGPSRTAGPVQFHQRVAFCTGAPDRPPRSLA